MSRLKRYLCEDFNLETPPIRAVLTLFDEGATIPFIARYRKERTAGLDEIQLKAIHTQYTMYQTLFQRQDTILKSIDEQGQLTPSLQQAIDACRDKQTLEDLYLPYKKRRKTKADVAIENGLQPLADLILEQKSTQPRQALLAPYVSSNSAITTPAQAVEGAGHIIAQSIANNASYRQWLRRYMGQNGQLTSKVTTAYKDKQTKYDMYASFSEPLKRAASHRVLAIRRGDKEGILNWKIKVDEDTVLSYLYKHIITNPGFVFSFELQSAINDAYTRLLSPSLQKECFGLTCDAAETDSIRVFSTNLRQLLMAPPAGAHVILGMDPGFRTGCKLAIIDKTGHYQESATIYPVPPHEKRAESERCVLDLIKRYQVTHIAIGNGTGSKETFRFIKDVIKTHHLNVIPVVVNESGASVYSASEIAIQEYPDLDITIRGAISIAHRLQDPLSELVKIDPKSIGVGQYQHDVNQSQLKDALIFTTEQAVNAIGVDLNTASPSLLTYVSGIGPTLAQHIVAHRHTHGPFSDRRSLLKVQKLGPKAFEQCAGFLRIKDGKNPLDNSAIHPESYSLVRQMAQDINCPMDTLIGNATAIQTIAINSYVTDTIGLPTLQDILKELQKPGIDPRDAFTYATFDDAIDSLQDLKEGMVLEGVVTNVTHFGAFVDIGVHQDGLIHISKLSNSFVKDPQTVISVGDTVSVTVLEVDTDRKRIQLAKVLDPS